MDCPNCQIAMIPFGRLDGVAVRCRRCGHLARAAAPPPPADLLEASSRAVVDFCYDVFAIRGGECTTAVYAMAAALFRDGISTPTQEAACDSSSPGRT